MTWKEELEEFEIYLQGKGTGKSYMETSGSYLKRLGEAYEPDSLLDLTQGDLSRWFAELREGGLKEASLRSIAGRVKTCLRWLNNGETPKSLRGMVIGRNKPRVESKGELVSDEEFDRLMKVLPPQKRIMFRLLRNTGARPGEVLGLKREDVAIRSHNGKEYAELTFRDTKTDEIRSVPIVDPAVIGELKDYLEVGPKEGYLFPSRQKRRRNEKGEWEELPTKPLHYTSLWISMKTAAKRVGLEKRLYPYLLRHTRATELMESPRAVSDRLMGWKTGVMWKNYTHLATDDLRDYLFETEGPPVDVAVQLKTVIETLMSALEEQAEKNPEIMQRVAEKLRERLQILDAS
ncbi:MAG: tyrosine-type recombinase/integrase [Thermoplasmata archaeon]